MRLKEWFNKKSLPTPIIDGDVLFVYDNNDETTIICINNNRTLNVEIKNDCINYFYLDSILEI